MVLGCKVYGGMWSRLKDLGGDGDGRIYALYFGPLYKNYAY